MAAAPVANDGDTEQSLTCLYLKLYHPHHQHDPVIFSALNLGRKEELQVDEVAVFGRLVPKFKLINAKVSRWQFSLQIFQPLNSSKLAFEIKNLSQKTTLFVDGLELSHLNKVELPPKCLIRFGDFQMLAEIEEGDSKEKYNICSEVSRHSLVQEVQGSVMIGIAETGVINGGFPYQSISITPPPVEVDENDL